MFDRKVIDALYTEAMIMADEARSYFETLARAGEDQLAPLARVLLSAEALKVSTRLMQVIAWLLHQRAVAGGEIAGSIASDSPQRLGAAIETDGETLQQLPQQARLLSLESIDLYARVRRLDDEMVERPAGGGARALLDQLQSRL